MRICTHKSQGQMSKEEALRRAARLGRISSGHIAKIRRLIHQGVSPNTIDCYDRSPLTSAVARGRHKAAQVLLEHGADPNFSPDFFSSPGYVAVIKNDARMMALLLKHGANPNKTDPRGNSLLLQAMQNENPLPMIKVLISAEPMSTKETALAELL